MKNKEYLKLIAIVFIISTAILIGVLRRAKADSVQKQEPINIACTADCITRQVTLCNTEYNVCVRQDGLFCNTKVELGCEYLFIKLQ